MRVLLLGSGGREHALAWRLSADASVDELHAAPGNPGIERHATCHATRTDDVDGLLALAARLRPDLVVVGPEAPLVAGLADRLRERGVAVFGPDAAAARIEGSKAFAKDVMDAAGVPTARRLRDAVAPCVVKADGLAAGKGVFVCRTQAEADAGLDAAASFGGDVVVEELLEGEEASLFALSDGRDVVALPPARDHKRLEDGDLGPNTGGMGAYAPVPELAAEVESLLEAVHRPVVRELAGRGAPFVGLLYAGLMLTPEGPRVLEFNARFGDPETQAILPLVEGDLGAALAAAAAGALAGVALGASRDACVTVVLAAGRYPAGGDSGTPIEGIETAEAGGALVFHAGTARLGGRVATAGGRILNVTAVGPDLEGARSRAYAACDAIAFAGMRLRRDVGARSALAESRSTLTR